MIYNNLQKNFDFYSETKIETVKKITIYFLTLRLINIRRGYYLDG